METDTVSPRVHVAAFLVRLLNGRPLTFASARRSALRASVGMGLALTAEDLDVVADHVLTLCTPPSAAGAAVIGGVS